MAQNKINSSQVRISTANIPSSWTIRSIGSLRIATRKITWASVGAGASVSQSITLPDGKHFGQVDMSYALNNGGGYVEWLTYGSQFGDTATNANFWLRNYGNGTSGKITITITCIYEV